MGGFFGPDDQRGDAYGWLTNQASHWLLGYLSAWALLALGVDARTVVLLVAVAFAAWEARQLAQGGRLADGLTDWAFVVAGSVWGATGGHWVQLAVLAAALIAGVRARA